MRYQYLLIDNDNTLMDFSAAEAKALRETLQKAGLPTDEATVETYSRCGRRSSAAKRPSRS